MTATPSTTKSTTQLLVKGTMDMLPLSLAVLPWGILAGSMAVQAGLTTAQAIAMSGLVFAGAAQLVSLGLVAAGASSITILITVFFLTSQHFLYALTFRPTIAPMPYKKRLPLAFLLTDELFAVCAAPEKRQFAYMLGAGFSFYLFWLLFSCLGIYLANSIPNLEQYHLDFSIVATFIAIIIPLIKNFPALVGVIVSLVLAVLFSVLQVEGATVLAGLAGMFSAVLFEKLKQQEQH